MIYRNVTGETFELALRKSWDRVLANGQTLGDQLSPEALDRHYFSGAVCHLASDGLSGYVIRENDLQTVWSAVPGRGGFLVQDALNQGALTLDCFDGYLPSFYARHGFREVRRESNWTPGGPDVVYMEVK